MLTLLSNKQNKICAGKFFMTKIPTTFEMDELLKQQDIDNRHFIMGQCNGCNEWSKWDNRVGKWECTYCGSEKYDRRGSKSIRTWLTTKDLKKIKTNKRHSN